MKKILVILTICILSITGCSKGDNQSFEKYMEEGRMAVANQEYDKALNFFTLALEENKDDTDAKSLYNQTKNLVEAIDSKDQKNYTVAIQLCDVISNMESNTNIIKDAAENVKKESNELMEKAQRQDKEKEREKEKTQAKEENIKENISNDTTNESSTKQYYLKRLSEVEDEVAYLQKSSNNGSTAELREMVGKCYTKWDDLLNSIYGVLKTQLSESEMNSLRNKQRSWIKYRDSEADKAAAEYEGGSMAPLEATSVKAELTRQRCYELVNQYMK